MEFENQMRRHARLLRRSQNLLRRARKLQGRHGDVHGRSELAKLVQSHRPCLNVADMDLVAPGNDNGIVIVIVTV